MSEQTVQPTIDVAIHKKLLKIKEEVGAIGKDRRGQGISYSFRGIDDIYNAMHTAMLRHGVMHYPQVVPGTLVREVKELSTKDGRTRLQTQVSFVLRIEFIDVDTGRGCFMTTPAAGYDDSDKADGKAMSYGMKTGLAHCLGIPTEIDPDAERPDTTQDPEAVVNALIRKMTVAAERSDAEAAYKAAPAYAKKHPDVRKVAEALKSRFA